MCADPGRCSESGLGAAPSPRSSHSAATQRRGPTPAGRGAAEVTPSQECEGRFSCPPTVQGAWDCFPQPKHTTHALFRWRPLGWSWCERPWLLEPRARPHPSQLGRRPDSGWPDGGALGEQARGSQPALQSPAPRPARPSPELGARPRGCSPGDRFLRSVLNYPSSPQSCCALKSGKGLRMGAGGDLPLRSAPPPRGFCCRRASANSSPSSVLLLLFQIIIV